MSEPFEFEWDLEKNRQNIQKHNVSFLRATQAFMDEHHIIIDDLSHSQEERRYFCLGLVEGRVMTVRFTYRQKKLRIFGAAYWRKGEREYVRRREI